jgi:hypothetical protein
VRGELLHGISVPEPNIFLRICTHTQTITISIDLCPPMLFKLHPCIQKLCIMYYPYTKSWLDQKNYRSFTVVGFSPERFLVSVFPASEKLDSNLELDAGMHKTDAHPCPPKIHGHRWAWAWAPNVGLRSVPLILRKSITTHVKGERDH